MASPSALLTRLTRQLSLYDEAAYTAMASRGLLRRAEKDLRNLTPRLLEDTDSALLIDVDGAVVTLREAGPAHADCSCPSSDICRHILCACLWLARTSEPTAPPVEPEINLSYDDLKKWAGAKTLKEAFQLFADETAIDVRWEGYYTVAFGRLQIECRYYPETGIEAMLCSCRSALACVHRVAALLAIQKRRGHTIEAPERQVMAEPADTLKDRDEVISTTLRLLEDAVSAGICHLSDMSRQRFITLSVSATAANLPRLSQQLHALADELQMQLARDARADSKRFFQLLVETYALAAALKTSSQAELVGWFKTTYTPAGVLDLAGVGAYQWQASSGYIGLTLLFWDLNARDFCSWSDVRPSSTYFSPPARFLQESPYAGAVSPQQLSQSRFKLINARKNPHNRLSSSTESEAVIICPTDPERLNFGSRLFTEVASLRAYARSHSPAGLQPHNPLTDLIAFRPARWGKASYDETTQTLRQTLTDLHKETISLQIPYTPTNSPAIAFLERFQPEIATPHSLIAYLTRHPHNLTLFPVSILLPHSPTPVISLSLQKELKEGAMELERGEAERPLAEGLEGLLTVVAEELEHIAERGSASFGQEELREAFRMAAALDEAGLSKLSGALKLMDKSVARPHAVLKAAYICQLCLRAARH